MTAVGPAPLETVLDMECGKTTSEPESLFVRDNGRTQEGIVVDDEIAPQRKTTIEDGLRPLLTSMKLFGLYSSRRSDEAGEKSRRWTVNTIYGAAVVAMLWVNVVRVLSAFTSDDTFGLTMFNKLLMIMWSFQCAVSQTAFYAASFSGRLAVVLCQTVDDSCARHSRRFSTFLAVVAWSFILLSMACLTYAIFFTDFLFDVMIAPFQNHIIVSDPTIPRIIVLFIMLYLLSAYIFSQALTFVLALIFCHQFMKVNKELGCSLDNNQERHVSDLDIETLRQRHQEISMTVSYLDDSLMFSNAAAFCCQLCGLIMLLYVLIFYHSLMTDPITIISHVFWMMQMFIGLTLTAAGGIVVHHYVSLFTDCLIICCLMPNTHRRRRRDETVESRRVGGEYTNSQLVGDSFVVSSV